MGFDIGNSVGGGKVRHIYHHIALLNKVASGVLAITPVNPDRSVLGWSSISSGKDKANVLVGFFDGSTLVLDQDNSKAVTTVRIQIIEFE
jgi:hypothetical protein